MTNQKKTHKQLVAELQKPLPVISTNRLETRKPEKLTIAQLEMLAAKANHAMHGFK